MKANRSSKAAVIGAALLFQCFGAGGAERTPVNVYVCHRQGARIFADRPCSPDRPAEQMAIGPVNEYTSVALPAGSQTTTAPPRKKTLDADTAAEDHQRKIKACQKLSDALERVHSKQRAGYRVKEGERLRVRETQLSQTMRRERCR